MNQLIKEILRKSWRLRKNEKKRIFCELVKEGNGLTLLDIGAAYGIEPRWEPISEELNYIGVEPDKRSRELLSNYQKCKSYKIINSVVWNKEKEISFNLCNSPGVSSVFSPNRKFLDKFPDSARFDIKDSKLFNASTLDIQLGKKIVDFVKLDIQGAEIFALKGMEKNLNDCLGVELEVEFSPLYKGQPLFGEISSFLNKKGFEFFDFTNLCRWERYAFNSYGQNVFGDGIWLRSPEMIDEMFPEKYLKYISICALYGRFDLINKILELLKPNLSKNYTKNLKKLIEMQKWTRKANFLFNYLIKIINAEDTTRTHLIY